MKMIFAISVIVFLFIEIVAVADTHRVYDICKYRFPSGFGHYGYLKVVESRYALLFLSGKGSLMVLEIKAKKKDKRYRILIGVSSTSTSSVGKEGPLIEISEDSVYRPGEVFYQKKFKK